MIRLLAIDLDGTLLGPDRRISVANKVAIDRARAAGITVMLASGRIQPSMQPFADMLGLDGPMICGNGTHAFVSPGEELFATPIAAPSHQALIEYATEEDLHLNLYTRTNLFFLRDTPWGDLYKTRVESVIPELLPAGFDEPFLKCMIVDEPDRIDGHLEAALERIAAGDTRATKSESEYLEFMDVKANKGTALARVAEALGIAREETAAIGDYLNDLEMLEWASLSATLLGGHPDAKKVANVVVSPNEADGVAEFIDAHVLKQRQ